MTQQRKDFYQLLTLRNNTFCNNTFCNNTFCQKELDPEHRMGLIRESIRLDDDDVVYAEQINRYMSGLSKGECGFQENTQEQILKSIRLIIDEQDRQMPLDISQDITLGVQKYIKQQQELRAASELSQDQKKDLQDFDKDNTAKVNTDPVNSPTHYNHNPYGVECIQAIRAAFTDDEFRGYLKGNVLKYLWRQRYKNKPLQDVRKASWYLGKLVEHLQKLQEKSNEQS